MDTPMTEQDVKALETVAAIMVPLTMREDFNTARRVTVEFVFGQESKRDMLTLVLKDNGACPVKPFAVTTTSTAVNPAKTGLQPMKCPCGGQITFRDARVGTCQKCGTSCRVMDQPPGDTDWTVADLHASFDETRKWRERARSWRKACKASVKVVTR